MKIDIYYDHEKENTYFITLEDLKFQHGGKKYKIPKGFISDGGSIPKFWQGRCNPFDGRFIIPFIMHDWFYGSGEIERKEADQKLYDDLRESGMGWLTANEIYYAVRAFGGGHFIAPKEV